MSVVAPRFGSVAHAWAFQVRVSSWGRPLPKDHRAVYVCVERDGKRYLKGTDMVADEVLPGGTRILIERQAPKPPSLIIPPPKLELP